MVIFHSHVSLPEGNCLWFQENPPGKEKNWMGKARRATICSVNLCESRLTRPFQSISKEPRNLWARVEFLVHFRLGECFKWIAYDSWNKLVWNLMDLEHLAIQKSSRKIPGNMYIYIYICIWVSTMQDKGIRPSSTYKHANFVESHPS